MKTAAAYIRVSTDDQLEYSPDSQLEAIKNYAKRNDFYLPKEYIFVDEGISGRKAEKRPEFMRMISLAKSKPTPFDAIIVWKFSRFARSREDSIVYKSMLKKQCRIDVISVSEQLSEDKTSILIEALLEAMDEYYSINLAEEVKRGMTEKAKRGEPQTVAPFGYFIKDKNFYIDEKESEYVKMIFNDFVSGVGYFTIAKKLNALGVRTHRGNPFENRTIEYIIRNPVYIGKLRWNPAGKTRRNYDDKNIMITDGKHQPIIDEDTFEKAQERVLSIKQQHKYAKPLEDDVKTWLRSILRCAECGGAMVTSAGKWMQCNEYARGKKCFSHSVPIKRIEESVLSFLEEASTTGNFEKYAADAVSTNRTDTDYSAMIKNAEKKLARITEAFQAGVDTLEEYKHNKDKIMDEINRIKADEVNSLSNNKPDLKGFQKQLAKVCAILKNDKVSIKEKNLAAKSVIKTVYFSKPSYRTTVTFIINS